MINTRQTLVNLHEKFPTLTLDNLFEILDCIEEERTYTLRDNLHVWPTTLPNTLPITYGNPTCTATTNFEITQKRD